MTTTLAEPEDRKPSRQGRMLRDYRETHGLTYADLRLAMKERMGGWAVSEGTLKNLESGKVQRPYIKQRRAISVATGWDHKTVWMED